MNRTTIIADLQNEFAYLGSEEGDWLVEDLADYFLSLLQWKDVADGLPEVDGLYVAVDEDGRRLVYFSKEGEHSKTFWQTNILAYIQCPIPEYVEENADE